MSLRFLGVVAVLYALAALVYVGGLATGRRRLQSAAATALLGGVLVHALAISVRWRDLGATPIVDWRDGAGLAAFLLAVATLVVHGWYRLPAAGAFLAPVAFGLVLPETLRHQVAESLPPALRSPWSPVHISLAYLGLVLFAVASGMAVMYLLLERQLKRKTFGRLFEKLPDLESLDRLNMRFVFLGIALLTLAIATGALWAKEAWGVYWIWGDARSLRTLITWVLYAALVHARVFAGWRGHKAAILTVIGFVVMLGSFLGLGTLEAGRHFGSYE